MRALLSSAALALLLGGCHSLADEFSISGTVTISASLQGRAPRSNSVLFIIAKNMGGVPVAVRRIVNPEFPVTFSLTPEDLLVPAAPPRAPLVLQVEMNTHGNVGLPARGDLQGVRQDPVTPVEKNVSIVLDRQV